jgi:hypothetical protein
LTDDRALDTDATAMNECAEQRARDANQAAVKAAHRRQAAIDGANADAIERAITATEGEATAAEQRLADAMTRMDHAGAARAQRDLAEIENRRSNLRSGLDELRPSQPARPQPQRVTEGVVRAPQGQPQRAPQGGGIEDPRQNLMPSEQAWLNEHPDALHKMNLLEPAFQLSQLRGLQRGSKEYFSFLDKQLGYGQEEPRRASRHQQREADEYEEHEPRRVAAPVSRSGGGGSKLKPGQVMLTAAEREAARFSGVSEAEYAAQKVRLREEKQMGLHGAMPGG